MNLKFPRAIMVFTSILSGCSNSVNFYNNGGNNGVAYLNGSPIIEVVFPSNSACINHLKTEINQPKKIPGLEYGCNIDSAHKILSYTGKIKSVMTGEEWKARFLSKQACIAHNQYHKSQGGMFINLCH
jgi:hypothetical protein